MTPNLPSASQSTVPGSVSPLGAFPGVFELPHREFDLRATLRPVFRHLYLIIAIVVGLLVISTIKLMMTTRLYTAVATVLIKPRTQDTLALLRGDTSDSGDDDYFESFYKTQYNVLHSRSLAAEVIRDDSLQALFQAPPPPKPGLLARLRLELMARLRGFSPTKSTTEQAARVPKGELDGVPSGDIDAYLGSLSITPVPDTSLVLIGFTSSNAPIAAQIANTHARAYIREGIELQSQANATTQHFLQDRLVVLKEKLERSELALNEFRRQNGIVPGLMSVDGKNAIVLDRLADLSKDLTQAEVQRLNLEASLDLIHQHDYDSLPQAMASPSIQNLEQQVAKLQADYAAMAQQFKPSYPPLVQMQAKLNEVKRQLSAAISLVVSGIQTAYNQASDNEQKLQAEMDKQRTLALKLNDAAAQYSILQREVDTNHELYDAVLQRIKDLGVQEGSQASNVSILDQAEIPDTPSYPNTRQTLLLSLVLGLSGGVALAYLLDYLDNTLKDGEEVERYLNLPNLVVVPDFARTSSLSSYGSRYIEPHDSGSAMSGELVLATGNFSRASEAYRVLRTRILLSRAGEPPRSLLFTSATPAEGKTVSAINTAIMFAQLGVRVLIIDADLRHPRCHEIFKKENNTGLTEVLTGHVDPLGAVQPVSMLRKTKAGDSVTTMKQDAGTNGAFRPEPSDVENASVSEHLADGDPGEPERQAAIEPLTGAQEPSRDGASDKMPPASSDSADPTPNKDVRFPTKDWMSGLRQWVSTDAIPPQPAAVKPPVANPPLIHTPDANSPLITPAAINGRNDATPANLNESLYLMSSGSIPPNPSELLGSPKMLEILHMLEQHFDYVILDSPPIMPVSDSIVLATMVDGVVMVIDQERTPKQIVKAACARLEFARARILGTILNKVDIQQGHAYSYYDRYYYNSAYGSSHNSAE